MPADSEDHRVRLDSAQFPAPAGRFASHPSFAFAFIYDATISVLFVRFRSLCACPCPCPCSAPSICVLLEFSFFLLFVSSVAACSFLRAQQVFASLWLTDFTTWVGQCISCLCRLLSWHPPLFLFFCFVLLFVFFLPFFRLFFCSFTLFASVVGCLFVCLECFFFPPFPVERDEDEDRAMEDPAEQVASDSEADQSLERSKSGSSQEPSKEVR